MGKVKRREIRVRDWRIYTLVYADHIVLLTENEEEMKRMLERLKGYLDGKRLELNVRKTKILKFRKRGGRKSKRK